MQRIFGDRKVLIAAAFAAAVVICAVLVVFSRARMAERQKLSDQQAEMAALRDDYLRLKASVDAVEGRKSPAGTEGVAQAVDEVFRSVGLNQKVKSVKAVGSRDRGVAVAEEAEVQAEKLDLNEVVNILYRIENAPMILTVGKTSIRTSFENPSLLNLTMTVALIRPK